MSPSTLYITLSFLGSFTFSLIFTVNQLYFVTTVGMSPLELVLMGTILEASVFLFEIPTGIVADMKSRRISVIIGYLLMGLGFILEGLIPVVIIVGFVQLIWGLGFTFTSGATEAWIADEIGEERAGDAFLRGGQ
jgi:DHA3 family tetracycline resistance protein-like MFS transporter